MLKKIILFVATLAFVSVAFLIYQWQDETPRRTRRPEDAALRIAEARSDTTQPASQPAAALTIREGVEIPPGEAPMVQVFDDKGNARIIFQATRWRPVSDVEFHLTEPTARLLLPGGQLAYVRADEGQVVVQRTDSNNYNPKRGWLRGHVQLFIDLTKPDEENPRIVEPEQHPEAVWKIWLDDVDFDLDLARLHSDGPILVQSTDAHVEGRGLTLVWNEVSRRVKLLRIEEGKRASMRLKGLVRLGATDQTKLVESTTQPAGSPEQAGAGPPRPADVAAAPPPEPERDDETTITLTDPDEEPDRLKKDRIDTYEIVFNGGVTVEQRQGLQTIGRLRAEVLELIRELGAEERSAAQYVPQSQPEEAAPADRDSTVELVWSGALVVNPVSKEEPTTTQPAGDRFHVIATGNPVEIHDRETGDVFCRRLEYHDETQQVWLTGTADDLVRMQAGENRTVTGERIFLDRKAGLARVEGPGKLIDRGSESAAAVAEATLAKGTAEEDEIEIAWERSVEIEFGVLPSDPAAETRGDASRVGGSPLSRGKEYLKRAVFDGDVAFNQPGEAVTAERITVVFAEPESATDISKDRTVAAERILAEGRVRMANGDDSVTCDRLEIEMTTNDLGRNVPRIGRAFGNVVASRGSREIRASEELTVELESVPRPITPEERQRFETQARRTGIEPGSDDWKLHEERLQRRRQVVARSMKARGGVEISDPGENLEVVADALDCSFDDAQQITRALVVGSNVQPARVEMTDFYIRGARISMDLDTQSVDVPGGGLLRMLTNRDLDGRSLTEPIPIVVTWSDRMSLRGDANAGFFSGAVRVISQNNVLDCRELSLGLEDLPKVLHTSTAPAPDTSMWILGPIAQRLWSRDAEMPAQGLSRQVRKRLAHAHAVGDATIASSEYQDPVPNEGPFTSLLISLLPEHLRQRGPAPAASPRRLLSFVRVRGPSITIDLNNESLVVEGAGNLLVLDYRPPEVRPAAAERRPAAGLAGSVAATALQSGGPSQTVFTWQNSMAFLNRRSVAVIEDRVIMKHAAGSQVVLPEEAAAAMNIDQKQLAEVKGRRAELTCDNLVVRFDRGPSGGEGDASALSSAARLRSFQASVRVRMQENNRSVEGERVVFDDDAGVIRVEGSAQLPAWIADMDPTTGRLRGWRSPEALDWNLKTGEIRSRDSNLIVTGG